MHDRQQDLAAAGTNVLLDTAEPPDDGLAHCLDVLQATPPRDSSVLFVSYDRIPDEWVQAWLNHGGGHPASFGFLHVGETMRSAAISTTTSTPQPSSHPIDTVSNPADLTTLGITISDALEELAAAGQHTVICFDSLTALLEATGDLSRTFRFLHTLVGRVQMADARACYLIDGAAHDTQTQATLADLFDIHLP